MKKWPIFSLVFILFIVVVAWVSGWVRLWQAHASLQSEVGDYHDEAARRMAGVALTLARPYLDDEMRGRFLGRYGTLERKEGVMIIGLPADSYEKIVADLAAAIESWSHDELQRRGGGSSEERMRLLGTTTRPAIMELRQLLEATTRISLRSFSHSGEVAQAEREFGDTRQRLDFLLGEYERKH